MARPRLIAMAALGLAACMSYDGAALRPGARGEEIRATMGAPATVWSEADGGATWEYPRGPMGLETFMLRLDGQGRLRDVRQVLVAETFARLQPGVSTRETVRRLLGTPARETVFERRNETVWDYRYHDPVSGYAHALHVVFDARGIVSGSGSTVDDSRYLMSGPGLD